MRYLILFLALLVASHASYADCTGPAGKAAEIIYNVDYKVMQYCNGTNWIAMGGGGSSGATLPSCTRNLDQLVWDGSRSQWWCSADAPPLNCPNAGDICHDGSRFVGDTNLYLAPVATFGVGIKWSNTSVTNSGAQSVTDGAANQEWIVTNRTLSDYPAFQFCENTNTGNYRSDWYLPSKNELNLLYAGGWLPVYDGSGDYINDYWSSTEASSTNAWLQRASNGTQSSRSKATTFSAAPSYTAVVCVRRQN